MIAGETTMKMLKSLAAAVLAVAVIGAAPAQAQLDLQQSTDWRQIDQTRSDLLEIARFAEEFSADPRSRDEISVMRHALESAADEEFAVIVEHLAPQLTRMREQIDSLRRRLGPTRALRPRVPGRPGIDSPRTQDPGTGACTWPCSANYPSVGSSGNADLGVGINADLNTAGERDFNATYTVDCNRSVRLSFEDRTALRSGLLIAEGIRDIARRLCDQTYMVLGIGSNFSLICIVTDLVYHSLRVLEEFPALCDEIIDAAEIEGSYDRLFWIHGQFETHDTTVDAAVGAHQTSVIAGIASAELELTTDIEEHDGNIKLKLATHDFDIKLQVGQHDADIKAQILADAAFFRRTAIERALRRDMRLASIYLPAAQGGLMEEVVTIVEGVVADVVTSGEPANSAQVYLGRANTEINAGRYKRAWGQLSLAYFDAVKRIGESR